MLPGKRPMGTYSGWTRLIMPEPTRLILTTKKKRNNWSFYASWFVVIGNTTYKVFLPKIKPESHLCFCVFEICCNETFVKNFGEMTETLRGLEAKLPTARHDLHGAVWEGNSAATPTPSCCLHTTPASAPGAHLHSVHYHRHFLQPYYCSCQMKESSWPFFSMALVSKTRSDVEQ